jgi:site-specific DNA recombinase
VRAVELVVAQLRLLGISFRSATQGINDSVTGKLTENILAAFAQFDNDQRAARTIEGMRAAIQTGRWTFSPPLGYRKTLDVMEHRSIEPDPERAPLVRRAFELVATGLHSMRQVLAMVTAEGLRTVRGATVSPQTFQKTLHNPLYTGIITVPRWGPERWPGTFEAIVSKELFTRVQAMLNGKAMSVTPHQRNHTDFPLRRFVRCTSCDVPLTGAWSKGRSERYGYYRCRTPTCVNVPRVTLESEFIDYLVRFTPRAEYVALFREVVLDVWQERHAEAAEARTRLDARLTELRRRKDQLDETFIYRHAIDRPTYERQRDKLAEETALAEMARNDARIDELDIEGVLAFAEHLLLNVAPMWSEASLDQKQRLQRTLFPKGVTYGSDGFGTAETSLVFTMLDEIADPKTSEASPTGFEPGDTPRKH